MVQVPRITRNAPVAAQTTMGRINVGIPDLVSPVASTAKQAESLISQQEQYYRKQQENAWDTAALTKSNEFDQYINARLEGENGFKYRQGDPTEEFGALGEDIEAKYNEYLKGDLGDRERAILKSKLDQVYDRGTVKANTIYGSLYNKHETKVTNDAVELEKRGLTDAVSIVNAADKDSFAGVDQQIAKIRDIRWNSGRKTGLVDTDETGRERANESLRLTTANDLSDGLYKAIDVLNATGKTDEAQMMLERYKDYLDPARKKQATQTTEKATIRKSALTLADETRGMTNDDAIEYITKNTKGQNKLEVRQEALKIVDTEQRRLTNLKSRQESENFEAAATVVRERMGSKNPFHSTDEMMNDQMIKRFSQNMNAKQIAALGKMVDKPSNSNEGVKAKAYDIAFSADGFTGMTYAQFAESVAGLNDADTKKFTKLWEEANMQTPSESLRTLKTMDAELRNQMLKTGLIKFAYGTTLNNKDNVKYLKARDAMVAAREKFPTGASPEYQQKWVTKFVADMKKGEVFAPPEAPQKVIPTPTLPSVPKGTPPGGSASTGISTGTNGRIDAARRFKAANGGKRPTPAELDKFISEGN